jgi:hypothetical protein
VCLSSLSHSRMEIRRLPDVNAIFLEGLANFALDPSLRSAAWFNKSKTERDLWVDAIPSI